MSSEKMSTILFKLQWIKTALLPKPEKIYSILQEAVDFLADHDNVGSSKLGIIGTSMGAAIALNLAPLDTRVRFCWAITFPTIIRASALYFQQ